MTYNTRLERMSTQALEVYVQEMTSEVQRIRVELDRRAALAAPPTRPPFRVIDGGGS